jgi:hypothetical protein
MPAASPVPTLSQIQGWDTEHLTDAASHWSNTADLWESTFDHVAAQMAAPGGSPWEGEGAEAAQLRASTDMVTVRGLADGLHSTASIARNGAEDIAWARQSVLDAEEDAQAAGVSVGEDLSVTSQQTGGPAALQAAHHAQAEAFAADIRARAAQLVTLDQEVAAKITAAAAGIRDITFDESPLLPTSPVRTAPHQLRRLSGVNAASRDRMV